MGEKIKRAIGVKGDFKTAVLPMMNYSYTNIFTGGAGYIIGMYFMIFLTDVVNLTLTQAGLVVMIATVWDAVTDPVMGVITDRTRSRTGKHRRYLLWGIPLVILSYSLLWNSYGFTGGGTKAMIYYTVVYMLYKTAFTVISIPHTAMLPELAPAYDLRTQYNSVGYLFNSAGMVPAYIILLIILRLFGAAGEMGPQSQKPFLVTGIVLSLFFSAAVYATYKTVKEPSSLHNKLDTLDLRYLLQEYVLVFKNKAFRQYFFMSIAYQFATGFYANSKVFYIKYLANQYSKYAIYNSIAGAAEASAFPLNYALTMKFGKKRCGSIVTPIMIAGFAIALFMQSSHGDSKMSVVWVILMMLSMILYPFGMSGLGFVCTNVFPDLTDVDELITGRRREGVISTFSTLIKKSVGGVMAAFVTLILEKFGLITGQVVSDFEKMHPGEMYPQTNMAVWGIRICVAVIPILATLLALFLLHRFQMTKEDHTMIRAAVATKQKYGSVTLTPEQKERIEAVSGQKLPNTWLGRDNKEYEGHTLDLDENGEYVILVEKALLKKQAEAEIQ